ncbi:hypothetical protein BOO86_01370 [Mycobacterium sp. CBMA 234]|uniref:phage tail sheath C-terminal domain-containing protein n=1 Tax=Mycolicibacterium sp. CBMA 234 TaxID=1918495 RepID=UPI0012DC561A|nr:phage tail sheath C-terminal domain-containing protein [Mycolicibacterium sp. CBMA 234]MUL63099.1 hypothetical protein [Mycolicibacterium sp. CBMA 234]
MPIAPTYPGVYVEELPSGVHTITGVSTAVTAFLGYFLQGPMDTAVQIFSVADLERNFGPLAINSEAGYGIRQFFANGGAEAWVVRVASSTTAVPLGLAAIEMGDAPTGGTGILTAVASSPGAWGNLLRLGVDYNTASTGAGFNLTVTLVDNSSPPNTVATETYRNLVLDSTSSSYAPAVVNAASALIQLAAVGTPTKTDRPAPTGTVGGDISGLDLTTVHDQTMTVKLGGAQVGSTVTYPATAPTSLTELASTLQGLLQTQGTPPAIPATTVSVIAGSTTALQISSPSHQSTDTFTFAGNLATSLKLSTGAATGTKSGNLNGLTLGALPNETMTVELDGNSLGTVTYPAAAPTDLADLAATLQQQLQTLPGTPIADAVVTLVPGTGATAALQVSTVSATPAAAFAFSGTLADVLELSTAAGNVQQYALGGTVALAQKVPPNAPPFTSNVGGDGGQPDALALQGNQGHKTGMYALDNAPGFNILCVPDTMNLSDTAASAVITQAAGYCQTKYAFHVVDVPQNPSGGAASQALRESVTGIQTWMAANATLRSSYAALYYPRPQIPDPLNGFRLRPVASSGTLAGLYAQTDGTRGVWKAPAGTAAVLKNVPALGYVLNDPENGVLNQVGINCLRSLPVYGNICWGSRTLDGADQLESQWKYIPVRRLANYIEASLYQGIQWVVFEPNDEPLWSQIRLNVGTFMQQLFEKGAFQGTTPKSAYFVKCDSESTSQADIDQGIVNIIVGFAPLLPAEFVILQIQQIAGQSPT